MQDQLKNNFFSIALQGQQQKNIGGGRKNNCLSPRKTKANKKSLSNKPKIEQLIRKLLSADEFEFVVGLCWIKTCVTYL